jgi:hypothetical protein
MFCCYISGFVGCFLIVLWSTFGQILNVCGKVLKSGAYHLLPVNYDCIKVSIQFRTSECLLAYFLTFYAMLPAGVLSTAQTQQQCSVYSSNPTTVFCLQLKPNSSVRFHGCICIRKSGVKF